MLNNSICIVMGYSKGDYYDEYTAGVIRLANELGYTTVTYSMVMASKTKNDIERRIYDVVDFSKFKGIVLSVKSFYDNKNLVVEVEKRIKESSVPYVVIGATCFKELKDKSFSFKDADRFEAVTDHVIESHCCRDIHCLGGVAGDNNARVEGFVSSMKRHGLRVSNKNLLYGGNWTDCAKKYVKDIIFGNIEMPQAVVCIYDRIAAALVTEFFKNGIKVPDDIIVVGMDAESESFRSVFPITTSTISAVSLGERAMSYLHKQISGEEVETLHSDERVITGDSCGCGVKTGTISEIRRDIEKHEQYTLYEVYYQNSEFVEKLMRIGGYDDLPFILDNHTYLVPYMKTFTFSLVTGERKAECVFHSYFNYGKGRIIYDYTDILPPEAQSDDMVRNLFVLPVAFGEKFYGYITAGYHQAMMYNRFLQRFCRDISVAVDSLERVLTASQGVTVQTENPTVAAETATKESQTLTEQSGQPQTADTIYVKREGVLSRVNIENVLYFEALARKVYVALKSGSYEVKNTLADLEQQLSGYNFMRVSKSVLLNIDRVSGVRQDVDRSLIAVLVTKSEVRVSRKYADSFKLRMGLK
ncbi:MAG: LytTR family transcriptional regulator DNA-binding domain-containing protein [Oscillospiraceae bacterium]|nr:LytTR family transcriptional regulator DNA-binding domain-containing protein [Oscillospiraceae bacterium]